LSVPIEEEATLMHCPSFEVFGTYFPAWMLCALGGVSAAIAFRWLAGKARFETWLRPRVLVYPAIGLAVMSSLWLHYYGN
jgi:hypothetical protein